MCYLTTAMLKLEQYSNLLTGTTNPMLPLNILLFNMVNNTLIKTEKGLKIYFITNT